VATLHRTASRTRERNTAATSPPPEREAPMKFAIYHREREYAREMGDPKLAEVDAPTQGEAERMTARTRTTGRPIRSKACLSRRTRWVGNSPGCCRRRLSRRACRERTIPQPTTQPGSRASRRNLLRG
jgi:hypothetical protein